MGCQAQSNIELDNFKFPKKNQLPQDFIDHINQQKEYFRLIYREDTIKIKKYSEDFVLSKIDTSKNPLYISIAKYLFLYHYKKMIPKLIKRISNNKEIGLSNSPDILILSRPEYGLSDGHAGTVAIDDLFKVSGRANHLLKRITGQNFGTVTMDSTQEELEILQQKWIEWLKSL